jgi:quinol monooxygenase YgiN
MGIIRLSGHIDVPLDRLAEVQTALPDHIRLTLAEPGCQHFDVTPDPLIAGRFNVTEAFATRADFDAHQTRTQASDWARIASNIPRDYKIEETPA